ncbi:MAG: hypothetical protein HYZ53_25910 [Planctomycetes bacterium]|nr:hypothetical protein [Planctomycetota bacterium]
MVRYSPETPFDDEEAAEPRSLALRAREGADFEAWLNEQIRRTPWWAISGAGHAVALALLSAITFSSVEVTTAEVPIILSIPPAKIPKIDLTRANDLIPQRGLVTNEPSSQVVDDPILYYPEAEPSDHLESDDEDDHHQMKGDSEKFLSSNPGEAGGIVGRDASKVPGTTETLGIGDGGGSGGRWGRPFGGRKKRRTVGSGGGPERENSRTEDAVKAGLRWLARHQNADGSWDAESFNARCKHSICEGKGYREHNAGVTGLALLAYLGAGYTHMSRDKYTDPVTGEELCFGEVVKKAIIHLTRIQDTDGLFGTRSGKIMYDHAICALAMAESYGLTQCALFKDPAQRGIDFLVSAKNPYKAWRYGPRDGDNDTSVTGWCVMALKSARISGLDVPVATMEEARGFIDSVTEETYGRAGYTSRESAGARVFVPGKNDEYVNHEALTAVGMLCRIFTMKDPDPKDKLLGRAASALSQDLPIWDKAKKTNDYYYWYYGSLALFQFDGPDSHNTGKYWGAWNERMKEALCGHQAGPKDGCAQGSWDADDRWGFEGGRVYATAINVLTLEVYYRYESAFGGDKRK